MSPALPLMIVAGPGTGRGHGTVPALADDLRERRRKLLDLHYAGKISADLFAEREADLTMQLRALDVTTWDVVPGGMG